MSPQLDRYSKDTVEDKSLYIMMDEAVTKMIYFALMHCGLLVLGQKALKNKFNASNSCFQFVSYINIKTKDIWK